MKLLDTLYGLLAFIARAIGEPGDGSSREVIVGFPQAVERGNQSLFVEGPRVRILLLCNFPLSRVSWASKTPYDIARGGNRVIDGIV